MKKFLIFILLIAIVVFIGSPYYTAYQLKKAYDAKDGAALVSHIDFTQLQPNIQAQLSHKFANTLSQYPLVEQLGGTALTQAADEFITGSVNKAVTADNISHLIATQGQANAASKELAAAWAIASNKVNLQNLIQDMIAQRGDVNSVVKNQINIMMEKQTEELTTHVQTGEDSAKPKLSYCGINCFTISGMVKGYPITIYMQRQGLIDWNIVDIELP